jgi:hypothetical protein
MTCEQERIRTLFDQLMNQPLKDFPQRYAQFDAPFEDGVYVIYGARMKVLYVGRTTGPGSPGTGLRRRLTRTGQESRHAAVGSAVWSSNDRVNALS